MASDDNDLEGAVGGINFDLSDNIDNGQQNEFILNDLINIDELKLEDEENWLTSSLYKPATSDDAQNGSVEEWINVSASKFATESTFNMPDEAGDSSICNANRTNLSKKSLVSRLDTIAKGTPPSHNRSGVGSITGSSTCSSNLSPGVSSYLRQNLSSTPANKGISSRFDPRTFTRSHQKYSDASFGSPISGKTPSYSSNSSNQLLQLNISDISLVDCASPMVDLAESSVSSPMQNRRNMTFDRRKNTICYSSSPRKDETFSKIIPRNATNATYDKEQHLECESPKDSSRSERSSVASSNDQDVSINIHVPNLHDNPNSTFDIPMQEKSTANATFTCDENNIENCNYNDGAHIRKTTYAIPPENSTLVRKNVNVSKEANNANHNNLTYNECDTPSISECPNDMQLPIHQKMSRDSSQDHLEEDPISETTSGDSCSVGGLYRMNDVVGLSDVQQMARLQEESLKQTALPSQRSATISPSSEHSLQSPSNDMYGNNDNNNLYNVGISKPYIPNTDQEGTPLSHEQSSRGGYQQYSSQDSLPDSPYSSQSLDSQSTQGTDGLRRSMPNLNRIRGRGGGFGYRGGIARNSGIPGASANRGSSATSYGLSKIHNSDTRIGTQGSANSTRMLPPNAIPRVGRNTQYRPQGNMTSRQSNAHDRKIESNKTLRYQTNSRDSSSNANRRGIGETKLNSALPSSQQSNTIRQPSTTAGATALSRQGSSVQRNVAQNTQTISKIARPVGSGIPRPGGLGSRLPAPTAGRIPKLSTGSLPGSRASSLGPQRHPYSNEYC